MDLSAVFFEFVYWWNFCTLVKFFSIKFLQQYSSWNRLVTYLQCLWYSEHTSWYGDCYVPPKVLPCANSYCFTNVHTNTNRLSLSLLRKVHNITCASTKKCSKGIILSLSHLKSGKKGLYCTVGHLKHFSLLFDTTSEYKEQYPCLEKSVLFQIIQYLVQHEQSWLCKFPTETDVKPGILSNFLDKQL